MRIKALLALLIFGCGLAKGAVSIAPIFGPDMVLQRDRPLPVWGKADAGEHVTVEFAGQSVQTAASETGAWRVQLTPLLASKTPATLKITGSNVIELPNLLVGEVWLCSGQSNMDWKLPESADGPAVTAAADHPLLRLYFVPRHMRPPGNDLDGSLWRVCTPDSAKMFSAAAYYFGAELQKKLDVPVGIIHSSWGGTQAEAWTPVSYLAADPQLAPILVRSKQWELELPKAMAEFDAVHNAWSEQADKARAASQPVPREPNAPEAARPQRIAASLWHGMLEPMVPFSIRGVVWYQGESNEDRAEQYRILLPTLIKSWRGAWGDAKLPFGIVQLPNFHAPSTQPEDASWSHLRDAQLNTFRSVPDTGLIVTIDIGEADNIHPKNKRDVGDRAARWALDTIYGQAVGHSGPIYKSSHVDGNKLILTFDQVGDGLELRDGQTLDEFAIAGADHIWHWASAKITGKETVEAWADDVPAPLAARYAFNANPKHPNLTNNTHLPASPFRTDDWPGPTDGKR